MTTLNTRIASTLKTTVSSTEAAIVLDDVGAALAQAKDQLVLDRQAALDPLADERAVAASRKAIEETTFQIDRLTEAKGRLQQRFDELLKDEQSADEAAKKRALAERQDVIRKQFADEYPVLAQRIAALAHEMTQAGLQADLPDVKLGCGRPETFGAQGQSFNHQRYWPMPREGYEWPEGKVGRFNADRSGKLLIVHNTQDKQEKAA